VTCTTADQGPDWSGEYMRHDYTRQPRGNWKRLNPGRERVMAEGLLSGCDLPLIGRNGVVGGLVLRGRPLRAAGQRDASVGQPSQDTRGL